MAKKMKERGFGKESKGKSGFELFGKKDVKKMAKGGGVESSGKTRGKNV